MDWVIFFWVVLKSSLFSTGGFGPLPSLHTDFIAYGWASEKEFTEALAIGQITPGPNGLWVVSLCYLVAGLSGALIACVALLLPPLFIVIVERCYERIASHPATQGLLDGVVLVIVSFSVIVLAGMFHNNGLDISMIAIAIISAALAISRRVSANVILVVAALVGVVLG
ncbi:chromate transporter [Sporomusaceae bacterium BoRhaA]|uniref:chromate transporter n=1 Tax=Pelorhabdus rhamnosifermentans TaxID=2772457 RepID=UPI001C062468|nr:chromate transporter [Pelorhabdus rhamnosifermentans]MBU2700492.1 chromate transporter [Pelorhabdus rhamnosifermentans]